MVAVVDMLGVGPDKVWLCFLEANEDEDEDEADEAERNSLRSPAMLMMMIVDV